MIRHSQQRAEAISFFSFLSVILCTIGLLMFVLAGVTVVSFWGAEQVIVDVRQLKDGKPGFGRVYVECLARGLLVHPGEALVPADALEDKDRWLDGPFGLCLSKLSAGGSLFFLVRPQGIAVFRRALGYAFSAGGGTATAVADGRARFSVGHQMVLLPGPIRVVRKTVDTAR